MLKKTKKLNNSTKTNKNKKYKLWNKIKIAHKIIYFN